ncbi:MAG: site-specific DNA-methyltransferase [Akkermansiaceae bacterium]|nr:site-specific DNA-methyltransferase [Akkermansiaceae bacterium]
MFELFFILTQISVVIDFLLSDCLAGMQAMPAESVDLVVTSPPYNIGINYGAYDDTSDRSTFITWCQQWAAEVRRVMKDEASFFLNVGAAPADPLLPHQIILALTQKGPEFVLQNTFHWIKSISVETKKRETISAGHFKPIQSKRFVNDCHEYLFHLTKSGNVPLQRRAAGVEYADKSNIARWGHTGGEDKRCRGNNWFIPYETIQSRDKERPHPATFPVALVEQCIRIHGIKETNHLLDPFSGIGTSALAAQRMKVPRYTGFEIDKNYLATARERLAIDEEESSQQPL